MPNQCRNCVEQSCKDCLIDRLRNLSQDVIVVHPEKYYNSEEDFNVALTLR